MSNDIDLLLVGIDVGVDTGVATGRSRKLVTVESMQIIKAMARVLDLKRTENGNIRVYIEDARLRRGGFQKMDAKQAKYGAGVREGVGSVKRDSSMWEQFCIEHEIKYKLVNPAHNKTKTTAEYFKRLTGWEGRTNEHARDAAMLIYNRSGRELA